MLPNNRIGTLLHASWKHNLVTSIPSRLNFTRLQSKRGRYILLLECIPRMIHEHAYIHASTYNYTTQYVVVNDELPPMPMDA